MQPQLDAVHAGEHSVIATLPVCDSDGHIMCDHQGVSLALHALSMDTAHWLLILWRDVSTLTTLLRQQSMTRSH